MPIVSGYVIPFNATARLAEKLDIFLTGWKQYQWEYPINNSKALYQRNIRAAHFKHPEKVHCMFFISTISTSQHLEDDKDLVAKRWLQELANHNPEWYSCVDRTAMTIYPIHPREEPLHLPQEVSFDCILKLMAEAGEKRRAAERNYAQQQQQQERNNASRLGASCLFLAAFLYH